MSASASRPRVIVTCGPSYEPMDGMRRLTNASTGELGLVLANHLAEAGWPVLCLVGTGATHHLAAVPGVTRMHFGTNDDLLRRFQQEAARAPVAAIFQAAALCDFRVKQVADAVGTALQGEKHSSRQGELTLTLEPAVKVLPQLRALFPQARLVGWKYELDGGHQEVLAKGQAQLAECRTDLCVLNGAAWGVGFGALAPNGALVELGGRGALCAWLVEWLDGYAGRSK